MKEFGAGAVLMLALHFLVWKNPFLLLCTWTVFQTWYMLDHDEHLMLPHIKHHTQVDSLYAIYINVKGDARKNILRPQMQKILKIEEWWPDKKLKKVVREWGRENTDTFYSVLFQFLSLFMPGMKLNRINFQKKKKKHHHYFFDPIQIHWSGSVTFSHCQLSRSFVRLIFNRFTDKHGQLFLFVSKFERSGKMARR